MRRTAQAAPREHHQCPGRQDAPKQPDGGPSAGAFARQERPARTTPRRSVCCSYVKRLRDVSDGAGRLEQVPDAAGEVALEEADGVALGLAFRLLAGDVFPGLE